MTKKAAVKRYNKRVVPRQFEQGDLVLRRADIGQRNAREGKLAQNWEGPYRIAKALGKEGYKIETLQAKYSEIHSTQTNSRNITAEKADENEDGPRSQSTIRGAYPESEDHARKLSKLVA
ncbi:hypothetical protein A2U01_0001424 [Trifolium medium]|uniref:Gag-pol polyprotein n=1 Tax=Trifolium medium TaxID=97028 RepID=A0A392M079_9FABA|nr:hypothetical protein [Trifolium medium]